MTRQLPMDYRYTPSVDTIIRYIIALEVKSCPAILLGNFGSASMQLPANKYHLEAFFCEV